MSTLAVEFTASRMLQTVYGTSNLVWANVIGLVLIALSAGYFIGGRLADRNPRPQTFYLLVVLAGFSSVLFLLLTSVVLRHAASALAAIEVGALAASLLLVIGALVVPVTLLGCLSPYAVRLAITDVSHAGRVSGQLYALSTLGSLLGTYLPVLVTIPLAGSRATAILFGVLLLLVGLIGLWLSRDSADPLSTRTPLAALITIPLLIPVAVAGLRGGLKVQEGQIFETESAYNYIQVIHEGPCNFLLLNEGQAYHSYYCGGEPLQGPTVWSMMLAAPYFESDPVEVDRVAVVGLAAGTIAQHYMDVFGPIPIDGIELDPEIVATAQEYFGLRGDNIDVIVGDGRYELEQLSGPYDVITLDAYKVPYIPWHMTTREFFSTAADKLTDDGVLAVNAGRAPDDRRLVEALAATMQTVFPSVHAIDVPGSLNTILIGTKRPTSFDNIGQHLQNLPADAPSILVEALLAAAGNHAAIEGTGPILTDDRAPVETISDLDCFTLLAGWGPSGLPTLESAP
ncbi:MAG: fused MFS/spermidine synthase [Chloroflexota bacterium]